MKRILFFAVATLALISLVACGGGGSSTPTTTTGSSTAPMTINVGDATSDRLVAFEVTVSSITLGGSSTTSNLLSAPAEIELTHLSGKFEPLVLKGVPAGTYSSATIQLSGNAEAVIIPTAGGLPVKKTIAAPTSPIQVSFTAITVGSTPTILNVDFNLAALVTVTGDTVAFASPVPANAATVVAGAVQQAEDQQEDENGEIEDIHGTIASKDTSSFTLNVNGSSQQLKFTVDANTQCSDGVSGVGPACLSSLTVGMVVKVEGRTAADGSLVAREVEGSEQANGEEAEGIIVDESPATGAVTSLTLVVHRSASSAAATSMPQPADTITVGIAGAQFRVDSGEGKNKVNGSLPLFDATHIAKGQKVEADDDSERPNNLQAKKVKLKKQALVGTVSNVTNSGFTLTLDPNSFFVQLNPTENTIKVVTSSTTINKGNAATNGATGFRVRGLLFFDPTAAAGSKFTLIAGRTDHE